jgi:hypothetical protein
MSESLKRAKRETVAVLESRGLSNGMAYEVVGTLEAWVVTALSKGALVDELTAKNQALAERVDALERRLAEMELDADNEAYARSEGGW